MPTHTGPKGQLKLGLCLLVTWMGWTEETERFLQVQRYIKLYMERFKAAEKELVFINGKHARILGRITINNIVVDITGIGANIGDEVILANINPLLVGSHVEREYI